MQEREVSAEDGLIKASRIIFTAIALLLAFTAYSSGQISIIAITFLMMWAMALPTWLGFVPREWMRYAAFGVAFLLFLIFWQPPPT